jgi:hypothetical protein
MEAAKKVIDTSNLDAAQKMELIKYIMDAKQIQAPTTGTHHPNQRRVYLDFPDMQTVIEYGKGPGANRTMDIESTNKSSGNTICIVSITNGIANCITNLFTSPDANETFQVRYNFTGGVFYAMTFSNDKARLVVSPSGEICEQRALNCKSFMFQQAVRLINQQHPATLADCQLGDVTIINEWIAYINATQP